MSAPDFVCWDKVGSVGEHCQGEGHLGKALLSLLRGGLGPAELFGVAAGETDGGAMVGGWLGPASGRGALSGDYEKATSGVREIP